MNNRLRRVQGGRISGLSEKDCVDQRAFLDQVLGDSGNSTDFAIDHGDIKPGNIIIDEKCEIKW